ncbi:MAG: hypothetical protein OEY14_03890 [Myxococcales bacterium]|nr:hypothetical protein [Myxococcales bacterium]
MPDPLPTRSATLLAAAALLLLSLAPGSVRAQACCTATGSGEFGLVGPCHDAAISAQLSYQAVIGSYGDTGAMRPLADATIGDLTLSLGAGLRLLNRRLEIGVIAPLRMQYRRFGAERSLRARPGDVFVGTRLTTLRDTTTGIELGNSASYRPFLDLIAGLRLPTGRAPDASEDPLGADVTGTGSFELNLGLKITKFLTLEHAVSLSAIWAHRFSRTVSAPEGALEFAAGERLSLRASWLYLPSLRWSAGLFIGASASSAATQDGQRIEASATHSLSFGGYATWVFLFPEWEVTASLSVDPFFPSGGRNLPYVGPSISLFLKRGFL